MGVHACVSRHKGREAHLSRNATQPGSLGLGAGSGSPTLSLCTLIMALGAVLRGKAKGDLGSCRSHRLEVRPRSSPLTVDCSPLGPLPESNTQPSHEHPHGPALTHCQQRQHKRGGALECTRWAHIPSSATDNLLSLK